MSGFFAIGISHCKTKENIGTLWRSAAAFGASFLFTVGKRYQKQASDTVGATRKIPLIHFTDLDDLLSHLPHSCPLIGVEQSDISKNIETYTHLPTSAYLLGGEDVGLSVQEQKRCHAVIHIPLSTCLNVAVAGSIVMFHRQLQRNL